MQSSDVLILGGGAIGLSLAYELACHGATVHVLDRAEPGRASSWAGAGMIPPAPRDPVEPFQQLAKLSGELHTRWAAKLLEQTGIDVEYRPTGAIYVAANAQEADWLAGEQRNWRSLGIEHQSIEPRQLCDWEPEAMPADQQHRQHIAAAYHLPGEAQIRNPRFVRALLAGCARQGVRITAGAEVLDFIKLDARLTGVRTASGDFSAGQLCLAAGAWTASLASRLGVSLGVAPVRGQIALLNPGRPVLRRIINCGPRYLVPRVDGRVLVGSTMEYVGFDTRTTAEGIGGLLEMAGALAPGLASAPVERCWAGLRPGTPDGLPYLGRIPGWDNAFIAAGHYRSGLQLAPATAVVMSQLIRGEAASFPLDAFRVDRR
jgi:glycine oxidase